MRPDRVVSGGQTGVDQAVLRAARDAGIQTGGWAPRGWRTDAGPAPWLADFGLKEHESSGYPPRTEVNVRMSTGTLIIGDPLSPGCRLTRKLCDQLGRPWLCSVWPNNDTPEQAQQRIQRIRGWMAQHRIQVLNGAGNRERMNPGVGQAAYSLAYAVFQGTL